MKRSVFQCLGTSLGHTTRDFVTGKLWLAEKRKWILRTALDYTLRCVTRLDAARGMKQVWRPHVRTWGLSEANVLYWKKYLWQWSCWDFSAPLAVIRPPAVIWRPIVIRQPGNCAPLAPLVTRLTTPPQASNSCLELVSCGCKEVCRNRCKSKKANLECTQLCACDWEC